MVIEMDFKVVNKSKSSNSAIASKADKKKNKKSLSNAEFQPLVMKKRGVYVEKKSQPPIDVEETNDRQTKKKPPPRPRPGQKKFLASVLTILSKSTTGTQYPDQDEDDEPKEKSKSKLRSNEKGAEYEPMQRSIKNKKTKFKSRILKNGMFAPEQEQLIVLQSKKDIGQTSSTYSEWSRNADGIKWSDILYENQQPKTSAIRDVLKNNIYSGVAEGASKQILEHKTKKDKKLKINDDPVTLASEIANKDDKKLYNFFVDLLETTISVYNVKTEYEPSDISKTILEINESVAKKLDIKNDKLTHDDVMQIPKNTHSEDTAKDYSITPQTIPIHIKLSDCRPLASTKHKVRAKSFSYPNYTRKIKPPPKTNSFENNKRTIRRNDKKTLLNILKEQLAFDAYNFEEPESLYDALKVLARNKRRYEKSIRFVKNVDHAKNDYESECMFRRRRVVSFRSRKKNKTLANHKDISPTQSGYYKQNYKNVISAKKFFPSNHSLEVYGYDYEEPRSYSEDKTKKQVVFTYHSSPSVSRFNLGDCNALLNYPPVSSTSSEHSYSP